MINENKKFNLYRFYWENDCIWIIGTPSRDSFPVRIKENPKCAIGIVDLDHTTGKVLHAGFRGSGTVEPFDKGIATRLLKRYLGSEEENWDPRFQDLGDSNVFIRFVPETVVVRDQSFTTNKVDSRIRKSVFRYSGKGKFSRTRFLSYFY
jgi:hypothetical protein